jgi:hypothetical protein
LATAKGCYESITVVGPQPAVPAAASLGVFGTEGEPETGQARMAVGAARKGQIGWTALVRVVYAGVHSPACSTLQLAEDRPGTGIPDQRVKLGFTAWNPAFAEDRSGARARTVCGGRELRDLSARRRRYGRQKSAPFVKVSDQRP